MGETGEYVNCKNSKRCDEHNSIEERGLIDHNTEEEE